MDILLDTHTLLWMLLGDPRLKPRQRQVLENQANRIHVSAVSAFEIATKVRIGKLFAAADIAAEFEQIFIDFNYLPLAVTHVHGVRAGMLPGAHRDPFDRLLAAQSLTESMPLVTRDAEFRLFGVETVW